ncbi:polymer-forming cytoskeletal protein [Commensalibacter sp. M0402]|uniref:bactofilin family protein n=1 Tax=Commensalibacter TaxID=1079922 RepID=UPI0018DD144C|nr:MULTISPECIES: polymer-forming cytoskeletal protein [Commensalibacter]MBI0082111.1 polymer-forming cytoskeletal protein [Commensalibacter sp. W6292M3]MBI0087996.1 polymer-forming cytoskeletal protein [Commensalibacter melissae]
MNNLTPILEKKLINRNTLLNNTEHTYSNDASLNRRALVVGQGINIQGTFNDVETLIVEGTIETSSIKLKKLVIQQSGVFRGTVESQDIEITGILEGNITAQGNLTVTASGKLLGKAKCRRLKVEDGGQITGQVEMITTDKLKQTSAVDYSNDKEEVVTEEVKSSAT